MVVSREFCHPAESGGVSNSTRVVVLAASLAEWPRAVELNISRTWSEKEGTRREQ